MNIVENSEYTVSRTGQQFGPYRGAGVIQLVQSGILKETDEIWTEGMTDWVSANSFGQLAELFSNPPAPVQFTFGPEKKGSKVDRIAWIAAIITIVIFAGVVGGYFLNSHLKTKKELAKMELRDIPLSERHPNFQKIVGKWDGVVNREAFKLTFREDGTWVELDKDTVTSSGVWTVLDDGKVLYAEIRESSDPEDLGQLLLKGKIVSIFDDRFRVKCEGWYLMFDRDD